MAIDVQCPDCRKRYRVKDDMAGRDLKCKQCGGKMSVPDPYSEYEQEDDWGNYDPEPELPRAKSRRGGKSKKSQAKSVSAAPGVAKKIFAVIGMAVGGLIVAGSVYALTQGKGRAARGIVSGFVVIGVSIGWFRGSS